MIKSKVILIVIWFLCFTLSVVFLLIFSKNYTGSIWVTLLFDVIAFVSQLILLMSILSHVSEKKDVFNWYPLIGLSSIYLIGETIICIFTSSMGEALTIKMALIINFVFMIVIWVILLFLFVSRNHTKRLDLRQKNHHTEL